MIGFAKHPWPGKLYQPTYMKDVIIPKPTLLAPGYSTRLSTIAPDVNSPVCMHHLRAHLVSRQQTPKGLASPTLREPR